MKKGNIAIYIVLFFIIALAVTILFFQKAIKLEISQKRVKNIIEEAKIETEKTKTEETKIETEPITVKEGRADFGLIRVPSEKAVPPKKEDIIFIKVENCQIEKSQDFFLKEKPLILEFSVSDQKIEIKIPKFDFQESLEPGKKRTISLETIEEPQLIFQIICKGEVKEDKIILK